MTLMRAPLFFHQRVVPLSSVHSPCAATRLAMERLDRMFAEAAARAAPASTRPAAAVGEEDGEHAKRERAVAAGGGR